MAAGHTPINETSHRLVTETPPTLSIQSKVTSSLGSPPNPLILSFAVPQYAVSPEKPSLSPQFPEYEGSCDLLPTYGAQTWVNQALNNVT